MKKIILSIAALGLLIALSSSCKKVILDGGDLTSEVRDVSDDFSKIETNGSLDIIIDLESDDLVRVEAGENIIEHIETYVQNQTLYINEESNNFLSNKARRVFVNKDFLERIKLKGSGDLDAQNLTADAFSLVIDGSGDADISFASLNSMDVAIEGSGDCDLQGAAQELYLGINGSGDCNARFLEVEEATVNINGSGDVEVFVTELLTVNINGSGDLNYWGNPGGTNFNTNGSGDINAHN